MIDSECSSLAISSRSLLLADTEYVCATEKDRHQMRQTTKEEHIFSIGRNTYFPLARSNKYVFGAVGIPRRLSSPFVMNYTAAAAAAADDESYVHIMLSIISFTSLSLLGISKGLDATCYTLQQYFS
jgi:hypothetical protein